MSSCSPSQTPSSNTDSSPFFDLKAYFQSEIKQLNKTQPKVLKKVAVEEKQEEKTLQKLNYEQELKSFIDADINKVAWYDKYNIDSTVNNEGQLEKLTYQATENDLRTRSIEISFDENNEVHLVHIHLDSQSKVAGSEKNMTYETNKGFKIVTTQSLIGTDEKTISLEATFLD